MEDGACKVLSIERLPPHPAQDEEAAAATEGIVVCTLWPPPPSPTLADAET